MPKPGNRAANRLVKRFVTARLKAATHLLQNLIRRMGVSRIARSEITHAVITTVAVDLIAVSRTPLWLLSGWGCRGRRLSRLQAYTTTADTRSSDFAGANAIRAMPIMTSAATPTSSPRAIKLRNACTAISTAWAKLDHAVKAIRLRFADGSRAASSKKMPSDINAKH